MEEQLSNDQLVDTILSIYNRINKINSDNSMKDIKKIISDKSIQIKSVTKDLDNMNMKKGSRTKELISGLNSNAAHIDSMFESMNEKFSIFIVGQGKMGKSTLLNALIKDNKADIDIIPKTWKIDIYKNIKNNDLVEVKYNDGSSKLLSVPEVKLILKNEEMKITTSKQEVDILLKNVRIELKNNIKEQKEAEKEYRELYYKSPIIEVIWPCDKTEVLDNFILVDTPGLQQDLISEDTKKSLMEYYNKADGVLWLLNANTISQKSSRDLVDEISDFKNNRNIIGVINRIDFVRNMGDGNVKKVVDKAKELYGKDFLSIVPLSAKEALDGIMSNDPNLIKKSGYYDLIKQIEETFLHSAVQIRVDSKSSGLKNYCMGISTNTNLYIYNLNQDIEKYKKLNIKIKRDVEQLKFSLVKNLELAMSSYKNYVQSNIENYAGMAFDLEDKSKIGILVENDIFDKAYLNSMISDLLFNINTENKALFEVLSKTAFISEYKYIKRSELIKLAAFSVTSNQMGVSNINFDLSEQKFVSGAIATGLGFMVLGPLAIFLGPILGELGILKGVAKYFKLPKVKEQMNMQLGRLISDNRKELNLRIESACGSLQSSLVEVLNGSFKEVYFDYNKVEEVKIRIKRLGDIGTIYQIKTDLIGILKHNII